MENTVQALTSTIAGMCVSFDMDSKWFEVIPAKVDADLYGHTVLLKGRYLTDADAKFALNRWKKLISTYYQMPFKLRAKVVTRRHSKYITFKGSVGEAPPA